MLIATLIVALAVAQELPSDNTISIESTVHQAPETVETRVHELPREVIKERLAEHNLTVQQVRNMTPEQRQELKAELAPEARKEVHAELSEKHEQAGLQKHKITDYLQKLKLHKREMTLDDLHENDLKKLKLNRDAMEQLRKEGKVQLKKVKQQHKQMHAKEMLKHERMQKHLKQLKGKLIEDVDLDVEHYEVTVDGVTLNKTRFVIASPAQKGKRDMDFLVEIPKSMVSNASDVDFDIEPEILEEDPVVKWAFQNLPQKESVEYGFTVDGDVQNFEDLAVVAAEHQSILQRIINFFLNLFGA